MNLDTETLEQRQAVWERLLNEASGNQLGPGPYVAYYLGQLIAPNDVLLVQFKPSDGSSREQLAGVVTALLRGYLMELTYAGVPHRAHGWNYPTRPNVTLTFRPIVQEPTVIQKHADLQPGSEFCDKDSITIEGDGWSMTYPAETRYDQSSAAVLVQVRTAVAASVKVK